MTRSTQANLSRREAEILEILYRRGEATLADVRAELRDPPVPSAVRKLLDILEAKDLVRHRVDGRRHVFAPTVGRQQARRDALQRMLKTFFAGSAEDAVSALIEMKRSSIDEKGLRRIMGAARQAMRDGR